MIYSFFSLPGASALPRTVYEGPCNRLDPRPPDSNLGFYLIWIRAHSITSMGS